MVCVNSVCVDTGLGLGLGLGLGGVVRVCVDGVCR